MNSEPKDSPTSAAIQLGLDHHNAGRLQDAERIYREILEKEPNDASALGLLGVIQLQAGKYQAATEFLMEAVRLRPSNSLTLNYLGDAFRGLGKWEEAERSYRRGLALKPDNAEVCCNLGNVLASLGRLEEAESCYRQAIAFKADYADAHNNLGNVQGALGQPKEAERSYRQVLTIKPDHADAHNNLGAVLASLGQLAEAEHCYRQALRLNPGFTEAHNNLGAVLASLGRREEAERHYRQALSLKQDFAEAYCNLGDLLGFTGRTAEAERSYRKALDIRPDYPEALGQWVHQCQHLCAWQELARPIEEVHRHVAGRKLGRMHPFPFLALPDSNADEQYACAKQFAEKTFQRLIFRPPLHGAETRPDRTRLRIGYLSADFHEHATSYLLAEVVERHDHRRFEAFGYSYGPDDKSPMRLRMQAAFDTFCDIRRMSDEEAARQILADHIDILVDLKGYTANARSGIAALRPAAVQVSWLGYPGTLGHPRLADYLIGDPVVTPLEHAAHYSEFLALMPHCYQPNDRRRTIGRRPTRLEVGLAETGFVFCCFNQAYKVTPIIFDLWCRLLKNVPDSQLWLLQPTSGARDNLRREAAARGIAADRLVFAPKLPLAEHLGRLQLADLALDTYPVTSHTTASDALWSGVPLVTRLGDTFVSRVAASILHAAGLPGLVTDSSDSYYRLALELATDPGRLRSIRAKLAANRTTCPLFDSERFTRDLERLYERIWLDYREGRKRSLAANE